MKLVKKRQNYYKGKYIQSLRRTLVGGGVLSYIYSICNNSAASALVVKSAPVVESAPVLVESAPVLVESALTQPTS